MEVLDFGRIFADIVIRKWRSERYIDIRKGVDDGRIPANPSAIAVVVASKAKSDISKTLVEKSLP